MNNVNEQIKERKMLYKSICHEIEFIVWLFLYDHLNVMGEHKILS